MVFITDRIASKQELLKHYTLKAWAKRHGINDDSLKQYFYGKFSNDAPVAKRIVMELDKDGFLRVFSTPTTLGEPVC